MNFSEHVTHQKTKLESELKYRWNNEELFKYLYNLFPKYTKIYNNANGSELLIQHKLGLSGKMKLLMLLCIPIYVIVLVKIILRILKTAIRAFVWIFVFTIFGPIDRENAF